MDDEQEFSDTRVAESEEELSYGLFCLYIVSLMHSAKVGLYSLSTY
jgi:hypothetical protein